MSAVFVTFAVFICRTSTVMKLAKPMDRMNTVTHPSAEHSNNLKFRRPKNRTMVLESLNKTNEPKEIKKTFQDGLLCKSSICPPAWVKMRRIQNRTKLSLIKLFKTRNFPLRPKTHFIIKKIQKVENVISVK